MFGTRDFLVEEEQVEPRRSVTCEILLELAERADLGEDVTAPLAAEYERIGLFAAQGVDDEFEAVGAIQECMQRSFALYLNGCLQIEQGATEEARALFLEADRVMLAAEVCVKTALEEVLENHSEFEWAA